MLEVNTVGPGQREPAEYPSDGVSIGEAARLTGVSVHTLRYYEGAGLVVTPVDRSASGRRRYQKIDLDWIRVCTRLRATGMSIQAVRRYAQLVSEGRGNEQERLAVLEAHRDAVTARIAEQLANLELIEHKIDVYRGQVEAGDADTLWAPPRVSPAIDDPDLTNVAP